MLRDEKVLVTGGAGFIGSSLVERLAPRNEVTVLDDLSTGSLVNLENVPGKVHLVRASVTDREAVLGAAKGRSVVFHLAARTSVPESFDQPHVYGDVNVLGTANVLAAAIHGGARVVIYASTCAVYGATRVDRIPETKAPRPASPYAGTKLAGEELCDAASEREGVGTVKLRLFNVFGPRQSASSPYSSVIARFAAAVADGQPVVIYGSGTQTRDFVYVDDVSRAFEMASLATGARGHVINVASGRGRSILNVVASIERVLGRKVAKKKLPRRAGDIARSTGDGRKAKRVLGFTPEVPFEEGVRRVLEARGIV